ncbi:tetraacyldisaccharide 4'-kinase [Gramella sp. MAR_2010_147]|uniref:tetraacyldisaccharide 4'-kinase n=1 Tax=Gramella sp. MAR_2010_147 TaxID=1250205 RepID=UPI00087BBCAC|nr:tetraacyldisaccharide 4'-kinase [Gramella sp. MAR_2010_147]SDS61247.1 lipid-A-disaccharide kinase [Gramella sp. MAR_2010_147]
MSNLRKLLYPFSVLYHGITGMRNVLYDRNVLRSKSYDFPVICVGNLNTGGTGKSPMIEYLLDLLKKDHVTAILSRGYKRQSKGFRLVEIEDAAIITGDEPLQFKNKFPQSIVAVDANRREGIEKLINYFPDVILLDDAFQHRKVEAGFNILLTSYSDLYVNDLLLPGGNLRESISGASRAEVIVVTKCPEDLSMEDMDKIERLLKPLPHQKVYFTSIGYSDKIFSETESLLLEDIKAYNYTLVTGIANPKPLISYLEEKRIKLEHKKFPDHHNFSAKELKQLKHLPGIITTEKDYMRLKDKLVSKTLFYLPIRVNFLKDKEGFNSQILNFINKK